MEFKDYYKILGVSKNGSDAEIKKVYRKLARQYHPDLNPNDKSAESKVKSINEAYDVLGDPEKRKKYDELGSNWEQILQDREYARQYTRPDFKWSTMEDLNPGDFFEAFFGGATGGSQSRHRPGRAGRSVPGEDIESEIRLSLDDLIQNQKKSIRIAVPQTCPTCAGEGVVSASPTGRSRHRGTASLRPCTTCNGQGQTATVRDLEVRIPKGLKDGSRFRLAGQGKAGIAGGRNGDLYLKIRLSPHPLYRSEGYDLHAKLPLLDHEAALGLKISLSTPNGPVVLTIPPETSSGQSLRLRGKGLPKNGGAGFGDLYFHVTIQIPDKIGTREKELYFELQKLRPEGSGIRSQFG